MDWKKLVVDKETTVIKAMQVLSDFNQFVVVVDSEYRLLGTITDGDIRRSILNDFNPKTTKVYEVMNSTPFYGSTEESFVDLKERVRLKDEYIKKIPIVDSENRLINILLLDDVINSNDIAVVIMAGGLGSRLGELTKDCPKPLLKVGGTPILEIIINNLKKSNLKNIYISVNYKSEMIEDYFSDGKKFGVSIQYIREKQRMGTAGSLKLINFKESEVIVINGDVLTKVNFKNLIDFHRYHKSSATMCVREHQVTIPFGVVSLSGQKIVSLTEKPSESYFVNSGIYVLSRESLSHIPNDEASYDMPSLFKHLSTIASDSVNAYPVHEYWADIGQKDDYIQAQNDYNCHFDSK